MYFCNAFCIFPIAEFTAGTSPVLHFFNKAIFTWSQEIKKCINCRICFSSLSILSSQSLSRENSDLLEEISTQIFVRQQFEGNSPLDLYLKSLYAEEIQNPTYLVNLPPNLLDYWKPVDHSEFLERVPGLVVTLFPWQLKVHSPELSHSRNSQSP